MEEVKIKRTGSRQEVFEGKALKTTGLLTRDDLVVNPKTGKICSKKEMFRGQLLSRSMKAAQEEEPIELPVAEEDPIELPVAEEEPTPKKGRGRPRKKAVLEAGAVLD